MYQETSILLSRLVTLTPTSQQDPVGAEGGLLSVAQVEEVGQVFIRILTSCRHRVSVGHPRSRSGQGQV